MTDQVNGIPATMTKDDIFGMDDIPHEYVQVPQWKGGTVCVVGLSGAAKNQYQQQLIEVKGESRRIRLENSTAKLAALTIVDNHVNRRRLFSEGDVLKLGTKSAAALEVIIEVANRLSGMSKKEVEDFVKNSEPSQTDGSSSGSL